MRKLGRNASLRIPFKLCYCLSQVNGPVYRVNVQDVGNKLKVAYAAAAMEDCLQEAGFGAIA